MDWLYRHLSNNAFLAERSLCWQFLLFEFVHNKVNYHSEPVASAEAAEIGFYRQRNLLLQKSIETIVLFRAISKKTHALSNNPPLLLKFPWIVQVFIVILVEVIIHAVEVSRASEEFVI